MLRRIALAFLSFALIVSPAGATWSIVVVNRRTGEVGVAGATCVENISLITRLPVALPGLGGGVIQAAGSFTDLVPMAEGLRDRLPPTDIMLLVRAAEPIPNQLQAGVVALYPGAPETFTGPGCQQARGGLEGEVGDLAYVIQGNVLTGFQVVAAAETALLTTNGDLGQKMMAAMEAARALGGDGRCSCRSGPFPTSCGVPPPSFRKSAHSAFMLIARMGDEQPPCRFGSDCQMSSFHLSLNVRGQRADDDPVLTLDTRYDEWRAARAGRPDGIRSLVSPVPALPADGVTRREVTVKLLDLEGVPLTHGGAKVTVAGADGVRLNVSLSAVKDLGDGRYRFWITAANRICVDRIAITAEDALVRATLFPYLEVKCQPPSALHVGFDELPASAGGEVPFVLHRPEMAGGAFLLLASASGTTPPTRLGRGLWLPLVRDPWFEASARLAGDARFLPGTRGVLDDDGRAEAALVAPPGVLAPLIGRRLSWAAVIVSRTGALTTDAVGFDVVP